MTTTRRSATFAEPAPPDAAALPRVWEACALRPDVARGRLAEDQFAASLPEVLAGRALPVYQDPVQFFERTHITASLRDLLASVHDRLFAPESDANPILRLETSFGGGKTHTLIALVHAARAAGDLPALAGILTPARGAPAARIAGVVGTDLDPTPRSRDELARAPRTIWGELARQVGGAEGYALLAENDVLGTAPSSATLARLFGDAPALVMIDEIARYQRVAREVKLERGTLDQQVPAFLHALYELAGSKTAPHLVVVLTLASRDDAYGDETTDLLERLGELQSVLARKERVLEPVGERDLAAVVRRRLFERVDEAQAPAVAAAFQLAYQALYQRGVAIPADAARPEYRGALATSYPFHPALLNVLDKKVASIDTFNRTRGALRLLAHVLRRLFELRVPDAWLVQPGHVDLSLEPVAQSLSTQLRRKLEPIGADVVSAREGDPAHAQALDRPHVDAGRPPVATRVAQAVWLHSLGTGQPGCDDAELNLAVLTPTLDPHWVDEAVGRLLDLGWYLVREGHRLRFKDEPSLNKVIAEATRHVPPAEARQLVEAEARRIYKSGPFELVAFRDDPEAIEDDGRAPKLVLLHPDSAEAEAGAGDPPALVVRLSRFRNGQEAIREHPNQVVFLVANAQDKDAVLQAARRTRALQTLERDRERLKALSREQREELKDKVKSADLELRVAITNCFRHVYYASGSAGAREGLERLTLPSQDRATEDPVQQTVVIDLLRGAKKVLAASDPPLAAAYVRPKVWPGQQQELPLDKLEKAFKAKRDLPLVLDPHLLKTMVAEGARAGVWGFHDGERLWFKARDWPHTSPVASSVRLEARQHLLDPAQAAIDTRPKKPGRKPPKPGKPGPDGGGGDGGGGDGPGGDDGSDGGQPPKPVLPVLPPVVTTETPVVPNRAFEDVLARFAEVPEARVHALRLTLQDATDVKRLGQAAPLWTAFALELAASCEARWAAAGDDGETGGTDCYQLEFRGSWDRYRAQAKSAVEGLAAARGADVTLTLRATLVPEEALAPDDARLAAVRDELVRLGTGPIGLELATVPGALEA